MNKIVIQLIPNFRYVVGIERLNSRYLNNRPDLLSRLLFDQDCIVIRKFQQQILIYNMMFAFTSPGAKLDNRFNNGCGPPTLQIQGQSCHRIGSLLPQKVNRLNLHTIYLWH